MDSSLIIVGQKEVDVGTNTSGLVDLGMALYGGSLQIASMLSMMGGYQYRVMNGEVTLEICWRKEGRK